MYFRKQIMYYRKDLRISEIILSNFCGKFCVFEKTLCALFLEIFCSFQRSFGVLSKKDFLYFTKHLMEHFVHN